MSHPPSAHSKKAIFIDVQAIAGNCKPGKINAATYQLITPLQMQDYNVILLRSKDVDKQLFNMAVGDLNCLGVADLPCDTGKGSYSQLAEDFGINKDNALFITTRATEKTMAETEGLRVFQHEPVLGKPFEKPQVTWLKLAKVKDTIVTAMQSPDKNSTDTPQP